MLRKLATVGTVMHATAHPDDESNSLLAMQSHGEGLRVVLASATRGNGGQNEIGPELFEALGVLRTEELLAAHRYDGAEQFFARAVDFGYSFSIEESYEKWGKSEIVGDYVRLIRMTRPAVTLTMRPAGAGGGQHHQASARIAAEAFTLAGDATKYPEQLKEGLHAWQPRKLYQVARYGVPGEEPAAAAGNLLQVDTSRDDPLLGKTYTEIGALGRAMHKCQGMGQLLPLPGSADRQYQLVNTTLPGGVSRPDDALTDGLDLSLAGLASFAGSRPPARLTDDLRAIAAAIGAADAALRADGPDKAVPELARGLAQTRALRGWLAAKGALDEDAAYEIDFRLAQTENKFEKALVLAQGLRLEALADDGVVVPGQPVKVTVIAANRGSGTVGVARIAPAGVQVRANPCASGPLAAGDITRCEVIAAVPGDARVTEPYWHRAGEAGRYTFDADAPFGAPFRPTPFTVAFDLEFGGVPASVTIPVQYRYEGNIFSGEKRMELKIVPALTLQSSPSIAIVPAAGAGVVTTSASSGAQAPERSRRIQVTLTNNAPGASEADVHLDVPQGWQVDPTSTHVAFDRSDEAATLVFSVRAPDRAAIGGYPIAAVATSGGQSFTRGYDAIEYPHTRRRHIFQEAVTLLKVIDVRLPSNLTVGYVMGVGDQVPDALSQLGANVALLDADTLAFGDLSRFDAIVTGVRAYERRADLRTYNRRLIEYAEHGGTVVVQYNKFEFNRAQYGPYPAKVSSNRVTDENAPVHVLAPDNPVFTTPNRIGPSAWANWVQERGLYFLGERDPRYVDLVELADPFPLNAGMKRGALVEAAVGKGRWLYVGLGLWRQLPAGTDGAYQLMANIIALGKPGASAPSAMR
jgi:LmbE family N-acetylglucosaminyl deacetylase